MNTRASIWCSPGTITTCSSTTTATRRGRIELRRPLRHLRRRGDRCARRERQPRDHLVAAVPRDRYRDRDARSGGGRRRRALRDGLGSRSTRRSAPRRSSSTAATPTVRTREAAIGTWSPTPCAGRRGRRRHHERRRHPRRQGLCAGRAHQPARRARRAAVRQPARGARVIGRRAHGRDRERALAPAQPERPLSRRSPASPSWPTPAARPAAASSRSRSAARRSMTRKPIRSPPTTSWRAAATTT